MSKKDMEARKKVVAGAAIAVGLAAALTFAVRDAPRPMLDDRYFGVREKAYFYPMYNDKQPNKIVIEATKSVLDWMVKNGFHKGKSEPLSAAKEVNAKVYMEKNAPFNELLRAYVKEMNEKPKQEITADDFEKRTAMCAERSVFEAAVLREMGIDAQVLVVYAKSVYGDEIYHFVVAAKDKGRKLVLDPFYGIVEDNPAKYKRRFVESAGLDELEEFRAFPLLKYKPEYAKYTGEEEKKLDKEFKNVKRRVMEAP